MHPNYTPLDANPGLSAQFSVNYNDGSADCCVNGEDYTPGIDALRAYATTWPGTGSEFRKQYVLITNG